jgi:hypothetical protein
MDHGFKKTCTHKVTQGHTKEDIKETWVCPNSTPPTWIIEMKHLKKLKLFAIELKKHRIRSKQNLRMNITKKRKSFLIM